MRIYDVYLGNIIGKVNLLEYYDYLFVLVRVGYGFNIGKCIILSVNLGIFGNLFVVNCVYYINVYDNG